ncbi:MAG: hypothetical protein K2W82_10925 [Candidatus Obscuribacterales bacterium]|nr:hypothetical protein [Candidatus Obscuribacterales bacterium]
MVAAVWRLAPEYTVDDDDALTAVLTTEVDAVLTLTPVLTTEVDAVFA